MKILMLSSSLDSGGAETHICELASSLAVRGHCVFVATAGGALAKTLEERGVRHIKMPLDSKSPPSLLISVRKLRSLTKKVDFDIIHTHSRIAAFVTRLARADKRAAVVSTVHSHFKVNALTRALSFWGRRSIAVSDDLCSYLCREYGIERDRVTVIPNGIDTEKFSPVTGTEKKRSLRVLFASRLDADCSLGALLLCKIAVPLAEKFPGIEIELAGGGKQYRRLLSLASRVNERLGYTAITLCGYVHDMPEHLRRADAFVGVSRAALEAMACGVPTVLCGNEGFIGVLDSSKIEIAAATNFCCRGCELPDSFSLFDSIVTILEMKEHERHELGEYLREYVKKNNSLSSLAKKTEKFYLEALAEKETRDELVACGYYGFGNLGDDALLSSLIKKAKGEHPQKKLCIVAHRPGRLACLAGIKSVSRENIFAVRRAIRGADRLILGGGSILQDKSSLRSLIFYAYLIKYAHRHGVRVELWSNGLGPFRRKRARKIAVRALERCSLISLRDDASLILARSLGAKEDKLSRDDDLSSLVESAEEKSARALLSSLSLEDKHFSLIAVRGKDSRVYRRQIIHHIRALSALGITPLFIIMHKSEDRRISRRLAKRLGGLCAPSLTPEELRALIPHAYSAVGSRYHLLYLAKLSGIPITPFGDDPKIYSL